jgi:hypothetical protein
MTSHSSLGFWSQSFPFSCGPAALGGVLSSLGWRTRPDRRLAEIEIWRESTALACPGAHPLGLALAAQRRGFAVEVRWSGPRPWLWAHIRSRHAFFRLRDYVRVETSLARQCANAGVSVRRGDLPPGRSEAGLLLSTASEATDSERDPHWVGLLPKSGGFLVLDPLRRAPYRSSRSLSGWWEASGFEETRSWVGVRPRSPPRNKAPASRLSRIDDSGNPIVTVGGGTCRP